MSMYQHSWRFGNTSGGWVVRDQCVSGSFIFDVKASFDLMKTCRYIDRF